MKAEIFADLLASANEALEHAHGKRSLKATKLPRLVEPMAAVDVRRVREALQASQAVFAHYLNVSTKLVQAWEASRRKPDGPALVLLRMIKQQPGLLDTFYYRTQTLRRAPSKSARAGTHRRLAPDGR